MTPSDFLRSTEPKERMSPNLMGKSWSSVPPYLTACDWLCIVSFLLLLGITSGPAYAGWVSLGDTDLGTRVYGDRATLRSNGNLVTMWSLYDFRSLRTVDGKSYFSSKTHGEYDCAQKRYRTLKETGFSSIMGLGKEVYNDTSPTEWASITSGGFDQKLWKYACGKH